MEPFTTLRGVAAPFGAPNVDTDVIMPKQFLKGIDRSGLDRGVFFGLRFGPDGERDPSFVLNRAPWRQASFLVTGPNFGCGSSREHAVWGLSQLGIRALIGTSFAGIFNDNCGRNGILTIVLAPAQVATLLDHAGRSETNTFVIDLPAQTISVEGTDMVTLFSIEPLRKNALLRGLDAVSWTLAEHTAHIQEFEGRHRRASPWLY